MNKMLFALMMVLSSQAEAVSGNELMERARAHERVMQDRPTPTDWLHGGYLLGFVSGASFTLNDLSPKVCLPPTGGNVLQYTEVVVQYLKQNPAQLHRPAQALVREALERAFPCK